MGSLAGMGLLLDRAVLDRLLAGVAAAPGSARETTYAPFTGEPLAELPLSTTDDVATAYDARAPRSATGRAAPLRERAAVFLRLHDLVLDRQDEVLDLVQLETGKARRHAFEEVVDVALNARYYARAAPRYLRPAAPRRHRPAAVQATSCATRRASSASSRRGTTR